MFPGLEYGDTTDLFQVLLIRKSNNQENDQKTCDYFMNVSRDDAGVTAIPGLQRYRWL